MFLSLLTLITITFLYLSFTDNSVSFSDVYESEQKSIAAKLAHKAAIKVGTPKNYWYENDSSYEQVWFATYKAELAKRLISYELRTYSI